MTSKKEMSGKEKVQGTVGLVFIIFIIYLFIGESDVNEANKKNKKMASKIVKTQMPKITEASIKLTVDTIKDYKIVKDAAVTQKDGDISLVLIVKHGTSTHKAQEMGDNFLRLVMANSNGIENSPSKQIGATKFSYLVGVYSPSQEQIATGAKAPAAHKITW